VDETSGIFLQNLRLVVKQEKEKRGSLALLLLFEVSFYNVQRLISERRGTEGRSHVRTCNLLRVIVKHARKDMAGYTSRDPETRRTGRNLVDKCAFAWHGCEL
jgi:hypothetical protein